MEINSKKLERTSKIVNFSIASILCILLIALSNNIIQDIDDWSDRPQRNDYETASIVDSLNAQIDVLDKQISEIQQQSDRINKTIDIARKNYENEKQSYENWLAARQTIGSPKEDEEVLARAAKLDEYYKVEQDWRSELSDNQNQVETLLTQQNTLQNQLYDERELTNERYDEALRSYDLKVFLKRLLFALPILLIGIYFLLKFRKHKYWPLFLGFILFSGYVFFFGLVPYLPSYGGYIRYTVGIALAIVLGIYAINRIRSYLEKKKAELKESSSKRARRIKTETAEKALNNHFCPSCGKDFMMKRWDFPKGSLKKGEENMYKLASNYCRHCGLELFVDCKNCGTKNFAHLPFCSNCGYEIMKETKEEVIEK